MNDTNDVLPDQHCRNLDALRRLRFGAGFRTMGMLPVLIILCGLIQAATIYLDGEGRFLTAQNISIVAQQAAINTVLGAGMTLVILTGGIDLSVGSVLAASAVSAVLVSQGYGMLGMLAALAMGLSLGLLNGALIASMRLPPFIVTLGSMTAVRGIARLLGKDATVSNPDLPFAFLGNGSVDLIPGVLSAPWLALIAIAVILACWFLLRRTVFGVRIYAVGGNAEAARLAGINVGAILLLVYGASGVLAGLGGVMSVAQLYSANGLQLGQSYELDAIAAVILGGTSFVGGIGSIWGTLIGALIIAVLSNGLILLGVSDIWQLIVKGLVIIGAVALDRYRLRGNPRT